MHNEVRRKKEVQARDSAFPTLSAIVLDDISVDLLFLNCVSTLSARFTDSVSLQR